MSSIRLWCASFARLFVCWLAILSAASTVCAYTFTKIDDTTGATDSYATLSPSVNSSGVASFFAGLDFSAGGGVHIFKGSGGPLTSVASAPDMPSPFLGFSDRPVINAGGETAFRATLRTTSGEGLVHVTGDAFLTPTVLADATSTYSTFDQPAINSSGDVISKATLSAGGEAIIKASTTSSAATLYDTSGPYSFFGVTPDINDAGTIAFVAFFDAGGGAVLKGDGGATTTIADTTGPLASMSLATINSSGEVAFTAVSDSLTTVFVYKGDGTTLDLIADTTGSYSSFGPVDITDSGAVIFEGLLDGGGEGIFLGSDPSDIKIIKTGDMLFGHTVVGLDLFSHGASPNGYVAFRYVTDSDAPGIFIEGIAVTVIPEPSLAVMLLAPLLLFSLARIRS